MVVEPRGREVPVLLLNAEDHDVLLPSGTLLGRLQEAEEMTLAWDEHHPSWRKSASAEETMKEGGVLMMCGREEKEEPAEIVEGLPPHLRPLMEGVSSGLSASEHYQLRGLVLKYADVFAGEDGGLGRTSLVRHTIDTGDHPPIKQPLRRAPYKQQELIEDEVQKMLKAGVIESSDGPWSSPVVLVRKKDGSTRFCVDYRRLNDVTCTDAYPLPRIDESFDTLSGAQYFSTLDLASGYWQVEMEEEDRQKTAFTTRSGLYQFRVMPFGLATAPASFERLMEIALRGLQWTRCLIYLDDVICIGKTFEEALGSLEDVFQRLREAGLKLKPSKCELLRRQVRFLGHVVSDRGVECDPEKVEAVRNYEAPRDLSELRCFLGFVGYYRRFIRDFATKAGPLTELLRKDTPYRWTDACQEAFEALREPLTREPLLVYPKFDREFILDTDASGFGVGGVLSQLYDGEEKVIAYASRTLRSTQKNYCTTKRELLAVVAMIHHFRHYLWGKPFLLRTDHASLKWLLNFKDAEGMIARWAARIASYDFHCEIRPGAKHSNADGMSRCRQCKREGCAGKQEEDLADEDEELLPPLSGENWDGLVGFLLGTSADGHTSWEEDDFCGDGLPAEEDASSLPMMTMEGTALGGHSTEELVALQEADPDLSYIMRWKQQAP